MTSKLQTILDRFGRLSFKHGYDLGRLTDEQDEPDKCIEEAQVKATQAIKSDLIGLLPEYKNVEPWHRKTEVRLAQAHNQAIDQMKAAINKYCDTGGSGK